MGSKPSKQSIPESHLPRSSAEWKAWYTVHLSLSEQHKFKTHFDYIGRIYDDNENLRSHMLNAKLANDCDKEESDAAFIAYRNNIEHIYRESTKASGKKSVTISELRAANADLKDRIASLQLQSKTKTVGKMQFFEVDRLGTGSSGNIVFSGKLLDGSDGRDCAIKKMPINKEDKDSDGLIKDLERARKETQIMKEFTHENLIKYYDSWYDEHESYFYIAMQLCKKTLDLFIEENLHVAMRNPPQSTNVEILDILKQITEAVDYLHNRVKAGSGFSNIAHRDLKPQNILVGEKNVGRRDWVVVLADFGLSKEISAAKARANLPASTTGNLGTVGWRPPLFMDKVLNSKSDIFTLGLLYHYCIAGEYGGHQSVKAKAMNGNSLMIKNWNDSHVRLNFSTCLDANHLVNLMLAKIGSNRPSSGQILRHPMFWSFSEKLKFIGEINSKLSLPRRGEQMKDLPKDFTNIERAIDKGFLITTGGFSSWKQKLPEIVKKSVQTKKGKNSYDDTPLDLFRLIRNHSHHQNDVHFSDNFKTLYENSAPEVVNSIDKSAHLDGSSFLCFWTQEKMFPGLILNVWIALEPWKVELKLTKYYSDDFNFKKPMNTIEEK